MQDAVGVDEPDSGVIYDDMFYGPGETVPFDRFIAPRIEVELGPYRVLGHLHGPTTGDPFASITRRKPMIPITEATVAFNLSGNARMRDVDVVIINRSRASLVQRVVAEPDRLAEFGRLPVDPHAKDLTHEITFDREPES